MIAKRGELVAFITDAPTSAEARRKSKIANRHWYAHLDFRIAHGRLAGTTPWKTLRSLIRKSPR